METIRNPQDQTHSLSGRRGYVLGSFGVSCQGKLTLGVPGDSVLPGSKTDGTLLSGVSVFRIGLEEKVRSTGH